MPDSPPLRQIVYCSSAPCLLSQDEILDILRASRRNNAAVGVTGALLYADGNFMQALEGPDVAVNAVYARVRADPRHRQIITLLDAPVAARSFADWAMGFVCVRDLDEADRPAARSLLDLTEPGADRAHRMLSTFRSLVPGVRSGLAA